MAFELSFKGKTCVILGGAQGIGAECVRQFAKAGGNVAIGDIRSDEKTRSLRYEAESFGVQAKEYVVDVSDEEMVARMFDDIAGQFGSIDVLVFCAGILMKVPFEELSYDNWRKIIIIVYKFHLMVIYMCDT